MDATLLADVFNLVVIDLVLSGDNAVVIAMAVAGLPKEMARRAAIWGAMGAVGLRVLFAALASVLLQIPLLEAVGGAVLYWIAWKLLTEEEDDAGVSGQVTHFSHAVKTIVLADVVMSLDNILAVGGASHGDIRLLLLGLAISIPLVLWGSSLLTRLLNRYPVIGYVGAGVLAWTAGKMITHDPFLAPRLAVVPHVLLAYGLPVLGAALVCGLGYRRNKGRAPHAAPEAGKIEGA